MQQVASISKEQRKVLILSSLGGVLEFFDFIIYMFLVPYIEQLFFARGSSYMTTLKTLAVFSAGYLIRPFGGLIFSHFGDLYGRKVVFLLTVLFMALPSFAIGLLPTTAQIGLAAPIMLLVLRMMQGLALGGEIPAAMTFIAEHVNSNRHGIAMAILFFGVNTGLLLGSFAAFLLTACFTEQQILAYAWRIPFIVGGFFGIGAIILRRHLNETSVFQSLAKEQKAVIPLVELLVQYWPKVLQGILLVAIGSVCFFMYLYWPQYLHKYMDFDFNMVMNLNTLSTLLLSFTILLGGILSDRFGYYRTYLVAILSMFLLIYPLYFLFNTRDTQMLFTGYFGFTLLLGIFPSCYAAILPRLFPTKVRYSGIALCYNMSYAIFCGLSPIICTILIHWMDSLFAPAWYMMLVTSITAMACFYGYIFSNPVGEIQTS